MKNYKREKNLIFWNHPENSLFLIHNKDKKIIQNKEKKQSMLTYLKILKLRKNKSNFNKHKKMEIKAFQNLPKI